MGPHSPSVRRYPLSLPTPFTTDWVGNIHLYQEGDEAILLVPNDKALIKISWNFTGNAISGNYVLEPLLVDMEGLYLVKPYDVTSEVRYSTPHAIQLLVLKTVG